MSDNDTPSTGPLPPTADITPEIELNAGPMNLAALDGSHAQVLIQAGHLHTPDSFTGAESPWGREVDWTTRVRDAAVHWLQRGGISVISADASFKNTNARFHVGLAIFVHFDGSDHGTAGASIGYDDATDRPAADAWRALYAEFWPYRWMSDNYTADEHRYYGFANTLTTDAELVLELGDMGSQEQSGWLYPRLDWLGQLIAYFASVRLGAVGSVPQPVAVDVA